MLPIVALSIEWHVNSLTELHPNLFLKVAAWLNGLGGMFLKKHLRKEGKAFARDIKQKFKTR
jgi:hypothetical protein